MTFETSLSERRGRRRATLCAAARAALCVVCLMGCAVSARAGQAREALREKDVRRAEKVLARLRLLDEAAASGDGARAYTSVAAKLYPGLFVAVAGLRAGDLKTDLDTAVFLYEAARRSWAANDPPAPDCAAERPDIYRPLCLDLPDNSAPRMLLAKARLHARWAEAVVKDHLGGGDAETARALAAQRAARENDRLLAARVLERLRTLESLVQPYRTYADYEERQSLSKVGFERLERESAGALDDAEALLAWMPRGQAFYHLSGAHRGFRDGLFWYRKVHQSKQPLVSADAFAPDPLEELGLEAGRAGYTVAVNWRAAGKYLRLAERALALRVS